MNPVLTVASNSLEIGFESRKKLNDESANLNLENSLPKWAMGNIQIKNNYYKCHEENWLDRLIRWIACKLGIIVHGNLTQNQLEERLNRFDVQRLMATGPYVNPILSLQAQKLIKDSLDPLDKVLDVHLHNLGYDEGNFVNPSISARGIASWMDYFKFLVVRYAAGISSPIGSTQEARTRIHLYSKHFPKLHGIVLPIHKAISNVGEVEWNNTGNFLKNRSARITATSFKSTISKLDTAVSVHPLDPKWHHKLQKAHEQGIRLVKWMPPQSVKPDSEEIDEFYKTMIGYGMTLIAHSGPEHAIPGRSEWEDWGNPLRFRRALKLGLNVILAHCGHKDLIPDLDHPDKRKVPGYELFARLAREVYDNGWSGKLYGDLAAVPTHYGPEFIKKLLEFSQEPGFCYIYGSDYPYTNLVQPGKDAYKLMAKANLLDPNFVQPLREIRRWNPLLANFVFTRYLRLQTDQGVLSFPLSTFSGNFDI